MNIINLFLVMLLSAFMTSCVTVNDTRLYSFEQADSKVQPEDYDAKEVLDYLFVNVECKLPSLQTLLDVTAVDRGHYEKTKDPNGYYQALKANNAHIHSLIQNLRKEKTACQSLP